MNSGFNVVIYPVTDLDRAKRLFSILLDAAPSTDESYYVGFSVGGQEIGLDPNGHSKGMTGPQVYWQAQDIEGAVRQLLAAGAKEAQPVHDVGGGKLIASVTDGDGNVIALQQ